MLNPDSSFSGGQVFLDRLDARIKLGFSINGAPAHVVSKFLISKLLKPPGPLVDRDRVYIRLGVDHRTSGESATRLLTVLNEFMYAGAFHGGFERWWWPLVSQWWNESFAEAGPLARLTAQQRVDVLTSRAGLEGLSAIVEDAQSPGTRYWTKCLISQLPVDPSQGYPLQSDVDYEPWHEADYLCREQALRNPRDRRLSSADREKLGLIIRNKRAGIQG